MSRRRLLISIATASTCTLTISSCHPSGATIKVNGISATIGDTFSFNNGDRVTIQATYTDWPVYSKTFIITGNMSYDIAMEDGLFGFTNVGTGAAALRLREIGASTLFSLDNWKYSLDNGDTWLDATYSYNDGFVYFGTWSQDTNIPVGGKILVKQNTPEFTSKELSSSSGTGYLTFDSYIGNAQFAVSGRLSSMIGTTTMTTQSGQIGAGFAHLFSTQNGIGVVDASGFIIDVDIVPGDYQYFSYASSYSGYQNMFYDSTGMLTHGPTIELSTLRPYMLKEFGKYNGRILEDVTCYATDISATSCTDNWWSSNMTLNCFNLYVPQSMVSAWQAKGGPIIPSYPYTSGYPCDTSNIVPIVQYVTIKSCNVAGASITVNGNPANVGDSVECSYGDAVSVTASVTGYLTYSETFTIGKEDIFVNINMVEDPAIKYLTFDVVAPGRIGFFRDSASYMDARTIYYRKNGGSWTTLSTSNYDHGQYGGHGEWITGLVAGDVLEFKGTNNEYCEWTGNEDPDYANQGYTYFRVQDGAQFNVSGNIMSLCYGDNFAGQTDFPQTSYYDYNTGQFTTGPAKHVFQNLFTGNTGLLSAKYLVLPVTTLSAACYMYMFSGCTNMTDAPDYLPNATLANWCYMWMFNGCTSLQKSPDILTTTVPSGNQREAYCMFFGCSSLNYIKCLFANLGSSTTVSWLSMNSGQSISATGTFVKNAANTSWPTSASGIPSGWTVESVVV